MPRKNLTVKSIEKRNKSKDFDVPLVGYLATSEYGRVAIILKSPVCS